MRLLALLLAFVAFQAWWFQRETPTEKRLAAVATSIAREEVSVRCPSIWRRLIDISATAGGTAHYDEKGRPSHSELTHPVCRTFAELAKRGFPADLSCVLDRPVSCGEWELDVVWAVHALSQEAWHLAGVGDEATTECYAFQTDAAVARRFGAGHAAARTLAAFLVGHTTGRVLPQVRSSSDCRPGGPLDLNPHTGAWPSA